MLKYLLPIALASLPVPQLAQAQTTGSATRPDTHSERSRRALAASESRADFVRPSREARGAPDEAGRFQAISADGIDAREARQREAILRGVESGRLTPREADRLRHEQARIERHEQRARADGNFSAREQARIQHELDRSGRHIRHELNDRQRVGQHDRGNHHGYARGYGYGRSYGNAFGERAHYRRIAYRGDWRHWR